MWETRDCMEKEEEWKSKGLLERWEGLGEIVILYKDAPRILNSSCHQELYRDPLTVNRRHNHESEVAQSCPTLCEPMDCSPTRLLHPWNFPVTRLLL